MLRVTYLVGGSAKTSEFESGKAFVEAQRLEVPALEDFYAIEQVELDGKELTELKGHRIEDLYRYLSQKAD